ncbi:Uncharacterised protein [Mycobacteroides abscessus subsp. abscessus]|nr:Uncharacterised protein [Mycobacteroides abscessus subsp. abscessus]SKV49312.1 Uncharacterised protein [Mycobacteroides abscessus subsp. abscessus]
MLTSTASALPALALISIGIRRFSATRLVSGLTVTSLNARATVLKSVIMLRLSVP